MDLFAHPLIERLGWTLLHSLWQGVAIALAYALLTALARDRGPERRYALALGALAAMAMAPVATFLWLDEPARATSGVTSVGASLVVRVGIEDAAFDPTATLEPWLPWIVALWCTGVMVSALRVWGAWRHLVALRRTAVPMGGPELERLVAGIAAELGLSRAVRVARSALVDSPTVIGWLEPLILVPTSALAGLSPQQLAMILAHELAHIRRHDYLVNALQTVVETLLFYHPAVRWISEKVRDAREECCDAVAVRFGGDAIAYARALTELETMRGMRASLALAATGGALLERIERLLGQHPTRQRGAALASACALATLASLTASVGGPLLAPEPAAIVAQAAAEPAARPVAAPVVAPPTAPASRPVTPRRTAVAAAPRPGDLAVVPVDAATSTAIATPAADLDAPPTRTPDVAEPATLAPSSPASGAIAEIAGPTSGPAQDETAAGSVARISGGERLVGVPPSYPHGAERRRLAGTVTARLIIDATGRTQGVEVLAADPPGVFDRAVVRAVSNWRFAPLLEDGVAVPRELVQQFSFEPEAAECLQVTGTRLCRKLEVDGNSARAAAGVAVIRLD